MNMNFETLQRCPELFVWYLFGIDLLFANIGKIWKTKPARLRQIHYSIQMNILAALTSWDQALCFLVWWQGMVYHLGSYSFLVRTEIKKTPSEVRHKQKVLTLVISGCFMWLVQNYWPWYCSNTAILLTWEEPSLVSFISATAKLISKFSSAETVDRQEISWKLGHLGRTPSPKYWDLVQTQGCSAALNGG